MNKFLMYGIFIGCGALVGGGAGWFIEHKRKESTIQNMMNELHDKYKDDKKDIPEPEVPKKPIPEIPKKPRVNTLRIRQVSEQYYFSVADETPDDMELKDLFYYPEDDCLIDEEGRLVADRETMIGPHGLDKFRALADDGRPSFKNAYILNENNNTLFNIVRIEGRYGDTVRDDEEEQEYIRQANQYAEDELL